jgi:hypothetical protein
VPVFLLFCSFFAAAAAARSIKRQTNFPAEDTGKTQFLKKFYASPWGLGKHSRILCMEGIRCGAIISPTENDDFDLTRIGKYENE